MPARTAELSDFGEFLQELCTRSEIAAYEICHDAGIRTNSRITYGLRKRQAGTRSTTFTWTELWAISQSPKLIATDDERKRLVILGLKEHATPGLAAYVHWLETHLATYERQLKGVLRRPRLQPPDEKG